MINTKTKSRKPIHRSTKPQTKILGDNQSITIKKWFPSYKEFRDTVRSVQGMMPFAAGPVSLSSKAVVDAYDKLNINVRHWQHLLKKAYGAHWNNRY
jgi:hypothetical protein